MVVLACGLLVSCSNDSPVEPVASGPVGLGYVGSSATDTSRTFLTFNMAIGFDVAVLLSQDLTIPETVLVRGKALQAEFHASRPQERVAAIADSIHELSPDVVGLQEVLHMKDLQTGEDIDFLALLLSRLNTLGWPQYAALGHSLNPISLKVTVNNASRHDSLDLTFHEGNAILYRANLVLRQADSVVFFSGLRNIRYLDTTISVLRAAQYARLGSNDRPDLHVFNTHLEVDAIPVIGTAQANELIPFLRDNAVSGEPVVLLGDFNNPPTGPIPAKILEVGFLDTYSEAQSDAGFTCCFNMADPLVMPTRRIDYIFATNVVTVATSRLALTGAFNGAPARVSDHAGVLSVLTMP